MQNLNHCQRSVFLVRSLFFLLLLCAALLPPTPAAGADLRSSVLLTEPWGFYQDDHIAGIVPEIIALIEEESGLDVEMSLTPYARVWQELENNDTDFSCLISSPERAKKFFQSPPLFDFSALVIARKGIPLKRYEDLYGLNVGILHNIQLLPAFDSDIRIRKIPLRDYETLIAMLRSGRLDAIAGNNISIFYLLEKEEDKTLFGDHFVLRTMQATAQFSSDYSDLEKRKRINQAIANITARGQIQAILERWTGQQRLAK